MSPKAKAFSIYFQFVRDINGDKEEAKKSAIIVVNEILDINWIHSEPTCFDDLVNEYKEKSVYWNQVKSEIEKL
jgi:Fe-S oxidoreductase